MGAFTGKLNSLRGTNIDIATLVETSKVGLFGVGEDWKTASNNTAMAAPCVGKDNNNDADPTEPAGIGATSNWKLIFVYRSG